MNAWAFLVVSSDQQEVTLDDQARWARDIAAEKGWAIAREFRGVASGRDGPRSLLREMIAALRALPASARPAWILMIRADRLGRGRVVDTQIVLHDIVDMGVRIWTRDGGELKVDSAVDQIIASVKAGLAQLENEVRSDKRRATIAKKRAAGLPVSPQRPYGLKLDPTTKADVACEPHAEAVREAFRLRCSGWGYHRIGNRLREIAPAKILKSGEVKPIRWSIAGVCRMLSCTAYVGPVIDETTFLRAKHVRETMAAAHPAQPAKHPWPLSTAIRCWCGHAMGGSTSRKTRRGAVQIRRLYACRKAENHGGTFRYVRADWLETAFVEFLSQARFEASPDLIAKYRRTTPATALPLVERAIAKAQAELEALDRQRDKVWELHAAGSVRDEDVQQRLDALRAKCAAIADDIRSLEEQRGAALAMKQRQIDVEDLLARALPLYVGAPVALQRQVAGALAEAVGGITVSAAGTLEFGTAAPLSKKMERRSERGASRLAS